MNNMNTDILKSIFRAVLPGMLLVSGSCTEEDAGLNLNGSVEVLAFSLDEYPGTVDMKAGTITVALPAEYDTGAMQVTELEVAEGAEASLSVGDVIDFTLERSMRVTNADVYMDYNIILRHDEARIISFSIEGHTGVIDEEDKRIIVNVPESLDLRSLVPVITVSEGASVSPASGLAQDFTGEVVYTVTFNTARTEYTVEVVQNDAPSVIFAGLAATVDQLGYEERAAADWMLANIPGSQYVSFSDINAGLADLSECKVVWWHLHIDGGIDTKAKFEAAAPQAVEAAARMRELLNSGTGFVLTRYATMYAQALDVTLDGNVPNNCWGKNEETGEITGGPWSFFIQGSESHPLYEGIGTFTEEGKVGIYTCDAGYRITNSTAQWHIGSDWGGYPALADWSTVHGGTALGYGGDGAVVAWEYGSDDVRGKVICIGSGCYDWYAYGVDYSADQYHGNVEILTENAINYVMKK